MRKNEGDIGVFNPDMDDFVTTYDIDGNGLPKIFTAYAQDITYFVPTVAEHIKKHLANRLVMKRSIKQNYQADFDKTLKELDPDYDRG